MFMSYKPDIPDQAREAAIEYAGARAPDEPLGAQPALDGTDAPLADVLPEAIPRVLRELDARLSSIGGRVSQLEARAEYADATPRPIQLWAPRVPLLASLQ